MSFLTALDFTTPTLKVGIGGNYYIVCNDKCKLVSVCERIGKSSGSIYFNIKYNCWVIRIKSKSMKHKIKNIDW